MRLLVLGGTAFVGRHIAAAALARGHTLTLLNRGRRNAGLFPAAEHLIGDRDGDLSALRGRHFDAVVDVSGYTARHVLASTEALGAGAAHYLFVSSVAAYRACPPGLAYDETAPLADGDDGYGPSKARAEEALVARLPGRLTRVRPGLVVGPHDPTGRFTHWPLRVAEGGDVLAPGRPARPVQWIDARDLAAFVLQRAEAGAPAATPVYNATGPAQQATMQDLLDTCRAVTGSAARWHWMPDAQLLAHGVKPWTELPLWLPEDDPALGGFLLAISRRAQAAGLALRPLAETVRDTLAWARATEAPPPEADRPGPLSRERETALLGALARGVDGAVSPAASGAAAHARTPRPATARPPAAARRTAHRR